MKKIFIFTSLSCYIIVMAACGKSSSSTNVDKASPQNNCQYQLDSSSRQAMAVSAYKMAVFCKLSEADLLSLLN